MLGVTIWTPCIQVRMLKQQNNTLADDAASAKFKLLDAQQEQLKLKSQIVEVRTHTLLHGASLDFPEVCQLLHTPSASTYAPSQPCGTWL